MYRHFQISSEISIVDVHGKRAISRSRYIGLEIDTACLYIPFIQKRSENETIQVSTIRYKVSSPNRHNVRKTGLFFVSYCKRDIGDKVDKY